MENGKKVYGFLNNLFIIANLNLNKELNDEELMFNLEAKKFIIFVFFNNMNEAFCDVSIKLIKCYLALKNNIKYIEVNDNIIENELPNYFDIYKKLLSVNTYMKNSNLYSFDISEEAFKSIMLFYDYYKDYRKPNMEEICENSYFDVSKKISDINEEKILKNKENTLELKKNASEIKDNLVKEIIHNLINLYRSSFILDLFGIENEYFDVLLSSLYDLNNLIFDNKNIDRLLFDTTYTVYKEGKYNLKSYSLNHNINAFNLLKDTINKLK